MKPAKVTPRALDPDRAEAIKAAVAGLDGGRVMGKTIRVGDCVGCPFLHHYEHIGAGDDFCEHPDAKDGSNLSYPEIRWPPGWCPLRSGPVTVELEEGA